MSLRAVHLFVIGASIVLLIFFGVWAVQQFRLGGRDTTLVWGIASLAGGAVLIPYMVWFIQKTRKL
jgi:hypothetical protein